jgi:hypothetical protein
VLGEAGLAAHDARPRPRQTEARRRHPAGGHPGARQGSLRHGPHPERDRAGPRQDARARTATMALMQSAIGAHDPRWAEHCRITGCQVVRRMILFGDLGRISPSHPDETPASATLQPAVSFSCYWLCGRRLFYRCCASIRMHAAAQVRLRLCSNVQRHWTPTCRAVRRP